MKKIVCTILAIVLSAIAFCGCNSPAVEQPKTDTLFQETDTLLVENGKSRYSIVVPLNYSYTEGYAAQELQDLLYESTGCKLPVISDNGLKRDNGQYYLSVGNTKLLKEEDISITYDVLGETGVRVVKIGNNVYMCGATDRGTLNSVYQFLEHQIGFKTYAHDYTHVDYYNKLNVLDFDYEYKPSVEWSIAVEGVLQGKDALGSAARMYMYGEANPINGYARRFSELDGSDLFSFWCHEGAWLVPSTEYPQYWKNGAYCMTNEDAFAAYLEAVIKVVDNSTQTMMMLGGADNSGVCDCATCAADAKAYGGYGGVYMRFLNRIAREVETHLKENNAERNLFIVGLCYGGYKEAPATKNEKGEFVAVDASVIGKNDGFVKVGACYAPIRACYVHPFGENTCDSNVPIMRTLNGWKAVCEELYLYTYGTNFHALIYPYYNYSFMAESYKLYEEYGIRFAYDQSDAWNGVGHMSELRTFVRASLGWDAHQDINELIDEFIGAYYGPALGAMQLYFDTVQDHYNFISAKAGTSCQDCRFKLAIKDYWPRTSLMQFQGILMKAKLDVRASSLNETEKEIYLERIEREYIVMKTIEYSLYKSTLSGNELAELEKFVWEGRIKYDIGRMEEHVIDWMPGEMPDLENIK